jgi:hypothetical protein
MSAPAPAIARVRYLSGKVRLGDAAHVTGYLALIFGLLVLVSPVSFPAMIVETWRSGRLIPILTAFSVALNAGMYLQIAHKQSARPEPLISAVMGSLTVITVMGSALLMEFAVLHTQLQFLPNTQARVTEEVLAHVYFALISSIFVPHLLVRFGQNLFTKTRA